MANQFDEFSKTLGKSTSRREALKLLGGGLAGGLLAALGVGSAAAAPDRCSVFCQGFGIRGAALAQCKQACKKCGGDTSRLCGSDYNNNFTCCPSGQGCFFNCNVNSSTCCEEDVNCSGSCAGTCCP